MTRRRYTASQRLVSLATIGMPQPVRTVLGFRLISKLLVFLIPLALVTGIMTIRWEDGAPQFSVNAERARQLRQEALDKVRQHYPQTLLPPPAPPQPQGEPQPPWDMQPPVILPPAYPPYQNSGRVYGPPPYQPPTAYVPGSRPPRY